MARALTTKPHIQAICASNFCHYIVIKMALFTTRLWEAEQRLSRVRSWD